MLRLRLSPGMRDHIPRPGSGQVCRLRLDETCGLLTGDQPLLGWLVAGWEEWNEHTIDELEGQGRDRQNDRVYQ